MKSVKFQVKIQTVAEKTVKNFRGLLYFDTPCRYGSSYNSYYFLLIASSAGDLASKTKLFCITRKPTPTPSKMHNNQLG